MTAPIRSMAELLDVIRAKRDALNVSHETIDQIAGVPSGYTSKILAPEPIRGVGYKSLGDILGALAIALVPIEDDEQRAKVQGRWQKRKRPQRLVAHQSEISELTSPPRLPPYKKADNHKLRLRRMAAARKKA